MAAGDPKWDTRGALGIGGSAPSREGLITVLQGMVDDLDEQIRPLDERRRALMLVIQSERETIALEQLRRERTLERIQAPIA
jgi:hypothetical protein